MARFVVRRRWLTLGILGAITAFLSVGLVNVELRTIFSDLLPESHPYVQTYKDHPNFGNPLTVTILVKRIDGDIYNPETLRKVWDLTRDVDLAPAVDHDQILSIATEKARYAEATPYGIETQPLMDDHPPATPQEIAQLRERIGKSPNVARFMISSDETGTLIQATFIERLLDYGETFEYLQTLVEKARDDRHEIHMAGQPVLTGWVYRHELQMLMIFAITGVALVVALYLYTRSLAGVVTPLVVSTISAIWGFGFVGWLQDPIEPLVMVVPLLLVARAFSHCVQFTERYYEVLEVVHDRQRAAEISVGVMFAPSVLGIVTDAAGLFLIAVAPIPALERLAFFCGFWAAILIPTNVFLSPIILTWLPMPRHVRADEQRSLLDRFIKGLLSVMSRLTHGPLAPVTTITVVVLTVLAVGQVLQMKIGNPVEGSNLLWKDSEYNVAVAEINSGFPGLNTLEVIFETRDDDPLNRVMRKAETVRTMQRLQYLMETSEHRPEASLSFADYLGEASRLFAGGNPKWAPLDPEDTATEAATSALMLGTGPKAFSHVADFEQRNGTVSFWFKDNKQETVDGALAAARAAVDAIGTEFEAFRVRLGSGTIALQQSVNDAVNYYQWIILALLNLVMIISCSFAYRSIAAGLLLIVPVNLSNLFLGAVMTQMGLGLDVNTLPITAIGIGVGIDYGIYLLSRICEETRDPRDLARAIRASVTTTGKAIFFTATIVLLGILPWYYLSALKFLADMGLLLVVVMLINMVIALLVVPLLVWLFRPAFVFKKDLLVGESIDLEALAAEGRRNRANQHINSSAHGLVPAEAVE
ncbi:MAG: MMPL family transporter [Alphaproteobacteria bacterium]|nr:MMPL family transporter [Alphaproteobacteria bacterium]